MITTSLNTTDKKITKRINNNKRSRHLLCFLYQLNQDLIKFPRRNNRIYIQDTLNSILCISIPILLSISDWKLSRGSRWPSTVSRCLMLAQMRIKSPAGTTNCISLYIRQWRQQAANLSVSLEFIRREGEQINYFWLYGAAWIYVVTLSGKYSDKHRTLQIFLYYNTHDRKHVVGNERFIICGVNICDNYKHVSCPSLSLHLTL